MLTFASPWLFAVWLVPLVMRRLLPAYRPPRAGVAVPFFQRLAELSGEDPVEGPAVAKPRFAQQAMQWTTWSLLVLALARPQWLEQPITKTVPTRDMLLAVDLSGSMETQDFTDASGKKVDRLAAVKDVLHDFLAQRKGDRVGLIFFGSSAFVQAPFTEDLDALETLLDEAQVRMAGPKTAFGDAIGLALTVFEHDAELRDRVLIALTDGNDTGSQVPPQRAADIAHERKIVIHTIAVGDPTAAGEEKLDEQTLKQVAQTTGGRYAHASSRNELAAIYADLDKLETRKADTITHRPRHELFYWPLGLFLAIQLAWHAWFAVSTWHLAESISLPGGTKAVAAALIPIPATLSQFHFLRPLCLTVLIPALALWWTIRRRHDPAAAWHRIIEPQLLPALLVGQNSTRWFQPATLLLLVWVTSIFALAGPTWRQQPAPFAQDNAALVIVVEVTPTMLAKDIQPTRLERASQKIHDLLAKRPGTKTALVAYSGSAHLVMPLTKDADLIARFASELSPQIMPKEGDVAAEALAMADEQLRRAGLPGSILLIADGLSTDQISDLSKRQSSGGAPVQILAVAADADAPVPTDSPPAPSLNRKTFQAAANAVDGRWTEVTADDADIDALIHNTVTKIVAAAGEQHESRWQDAGYWLVFGVAALATFWFRPGWLVEWQ
jgi:Mg-chelatase subunit ChlD